MGYMQALEMTNLMDLEQGITWHLRYNHFPPMPSVMIPIAVRAIMLCLEDQFNATMVIFFDDQACAWSFKAYEIVRAYHLEPWCS